MGGMSPREGTPAKPIRRQGKECQAGEPTGALEQTRHGAVTIFTKEVSVA